MSPLGRTPSWRLRRRATVVATSLALARAAAHRGAARAGLGSVRRPDRAGGRGALAASARSAAGPLLGRHAARSRLVLSQAGPARRDAASARRARADGPLALLGGRDRLRRRAGARVHAAGAGPPRRQPHLPPAPRRDLSPAGQPRRFPTPDLRQTALPANAEILILWQMALSGRNAGARRSSRRSAGWARPWRSIASPGTSVRPRAARSCSPGWPVASLPGVVLQATTAQNDLTTAFFRRARSSSPARDWRSGARATS